MMMVQEIFVLIKATLADWSKDNSARLEAALAYYTTFSLVPTLLIVIALLGLFGRGSAAQEQILWQLQKLVGPDGRVFIEDMLINASRPATGFAAMLAGTATLLFGALGVFNELQNSLNIIWNVAPKPLKGWQAALKHFLTRRLMSFAMIVAIGFLLLVSLVISAALAAFQAYLSAILPFSPLILELLNFAASVGITTLLFAMIFVILPDTKMPWNGVWLGAGVTALMFTVGKMLIAQYLGNATVGSSFGAAGSLVVILIWIYYSAQILFLGAEFTQVYTQRYGAKIVPAEHAVSLKAKGPAWQGVPSATRVRKRSHPYAKADLRTR